MVLILLAIVFSAALLVWLWKVPIQRMVGAIQKNGSSAAEAYAVVGLLGGATVLAVYVIGWVI